MNTKQAVERQLSPNDRLRLFRALGVHINGHRPNESGWINGLRLPPALGDDRNPSFGINLDTGAVKDFGSDYQNDLYGFAQDVLRCSFPDALKWIEGELGVGGDGASVKAVPRPTRKGFEPVVMNQALEWRDRLLNGEDPASQALKQYLMEERGLAERTIENRGLGIRFHKGRPWLFIPYEDDGQRVTHYKMFGFDPQAGDWLRDRNGKKAVRTCGKTVLYLMDQALAFDTPPVWCEGEIDALLARQQGFNAVTGTGGAKTVKREWPSVLADHPCAKNGVTILFDGDEDGRRGAEKAAAALAEAGVPGRIGEMPDGQDISDVLRQEGGRERLQAIVEAAPEFIPDSRSLEFRQYSGVIG